MKESRPGYITMRCVSCRAVLRTVHGFDQGDYSNKCEPRCATPEERERLIATILDVLNNSPA
jgi:hypothetical protein